MRLGSKEKANRLTTLTYLIAGCLGYAIEDMERYLLQSKLVLAGRDKYLFNQLKPALNRVKYILNELEDYSIRVLENDPDEDGVLSREDSVHIYWYLFLLIVDRSGTDGLYDLRVKAFCDMIRKYKSLLNLPSMELTYFTAFNQVEKAIQEGKYSLDDFKNLLVYEDQPKETESEVSGENS